MIDLAILGLLKEQPLHGYELKKRLGETLGFLWGVSYGSLYPALRRLEGAGAIEIEEPAGPARPATPTTGSLTGDLAAARGRVPGRLAKPSRRTRKAYRITARGEAQFIELMLADDPHSDDEKTFALKLAFCGHLPRQDRLTLLERRRAQLGARLDQAQRARGARRERPARTADRYTRALVEHRTRSAQRDLEWVEELITTEQEPAEPIEVAGPHTEEPGDAVLPIEIVQEGIAT